MSAPTAGLPATDAPATSKSTPPGVLSASAVKQSAATARPWYGSDLINAADRKNETDPAIRPSSRWI